uniref:Uncharacterized protein n=1 Tax=Brassica oleracea var. oleracea TaxID=109376 RepID=A0A0D3B1B0_BRAOL
MMSAMPTIYAILAVGLNLLNRNRCHCNSHLCQWLDSKSAFQGNICRLIRNEIDYELNHSPPLQWISLTRKYGEKGDIKVEATMFDRSVPSSKSTSTEPDFILHITFLVKM